MARPRRSPGVRRCSSGPAASVGSLPVAAEAGLLWVSASQPKNVYRTDYSEFIPRSRRTRARRRRATCAGEGWLGGGALLRRRAAPSAAGCFLWAPLEGRRINEFTGTWNCAAGTLAYLGGAGLCRLFHRSPTTAAAAPRATRTTTTTMAAMPPGNRNERRNSNVIFAQTLVRGLNGRRRRSPAETALEALASQAGGAQPASH